MSVWQDVSVVAEQKAFLKSEDIDAWRRVAEAIVQRRIALNISQRQAGHDSAVGLTTWHRLENATKKAYHLGSIYKVERFLGWKKDSIDNLLTHKIEPVIDTDFNQRMENPERVLQFIRDRQDEQDRRLAAVEEQLRRLLALWVTGPSDR